MSGSTYCRPSLLTKVARAVVCGLLTVVCGWVGQWCVGGWGSGVWSTHCGVWVGREGLVQ